MRLQINTEETPSHLEDQCQTSRSSYRSGVSWCCSGPRLLLRLLGAVFRGGCTLSFAHREPSWQERVGLLAVETSGNPSNSSQGSACSSERPQPQPRGCSLGTAGGQRPRAVCPTGSDCQETPCTATALDCGGFAPTRGACINVQRHF